VWWKQAHGELVSKPPSSLLLHNVNMADETQVTKQETDTERDGGLESPTATINQEGSPSFGLEGEENPLNWPNWKKGSILGMVSGITFLSYVQDDRAC
jgi:hypothetical protein